MASQVELRWEEHRRQREAEEAAALGAADAASLEDIKRYFERRQRLKQEQQGLEDMQTGVNVPRSSACCAHRR